MTVALIRHGQTDWNLAGKVQGHTDIPLNDTGRAQALTAAEAIDPKKWVAITSSPLTRARETAQIIAEVLNLPLLDPEENLIEQHYGEAEGLDVTVLRERWPDRIIPGGENPKEVTSRGMQALISLQQTTPNILAVSHGAFIRRIIATVTGHEYYNVPGIENAKKNKFKNNAGNWQVVTINSRPAAELLPKPKLTMISGSGETCSIDGIC